MLEHFTIFGGVGEKALNLADREPTDPSEQKTLNEKTRHPVL
jgi:hypothetical protein